MHQRRRSQAAVEQVRGGDSQAQRLLLHVETAFRANPHFEQGHVAFEEDINMEDGTTKKFHVTMPHPDVRDAGMYIEDGSLTDLVRGLGKHTATAMLKFYSNGYNQWKVSSVCILSKAIRRQIAEWLEK